MYLSGPQKRIVGAIFAGTAIIAGAFLLKGNNTPSTEGVTVINGEPVVVTAAPSRTPIPIADSNGDGVADWQEALQNTEPLALQNETASSSFSTPETLTEQFALEFFEQMVRNENNGEFGKNTDAFAAAFVGALAEQAEDTLLTRKDIIISQNNTPSALSAYGEAVAEIINRYDDTSTENEATILDRALRNNDPEELKKLDEKIAVYSAILKDTLALPVPVGYEDEHLVLLNAYQAILADIVAMRNAFLDPMKALLRMKRYQDDATGLTNALGKLYTALLSEGASWPKDAAVFTIISINP